MDFQPSFVSIEGCQYPQHIASENAADRFLIESSILKPETNSGEGVFLVEDLGHVFPSRLKVCADTDLVRAQARHQHYDGVDETVDRIFPRLVAS